MESLALRFRSALAPMERTAARPDLLATTKSVSHRVDRRGTWFRCSAPADRRSRPQHIAGDLFG
jgi:hypothetical protein